MKTNLLILFLCHLDRARLSRSTKHLEKPKSDSMISLHLVALRFECNVELLCGISWIIILILKIRKIVIQATRDQSKFEVSRVFQFEVPAFCAFHKQSTR